MQVAVVVILAEEARLTIVPALQDVEWYAIEVNAGAAGHEGMLARLDISSLAPLIDLPLVPLVVQMLGLVSAKLTGKPDEVVAVSVIVFPGAEAVNVIGEAGVKPVMV